MLLIKGDRLKEATKINLSLSALGNVISALVRKYVLIQVKSYITIIIM